VLAPTTADRIDPTDWLVAAMRSEVSPADRSRRLRREDALQELDLATLAQAYRAGHPVYLGRGQFWTWDHDGIPGWLVPRFQDLGFLP
jgi:hypothetical protein